VVLSPWQITQILIAFGLLGLFPLAVKKVMQRWKDGGMTNDG